MENNNIFEEAIAMRRIVSLRERALQSQVFGHSVAKMNRDELLIVIGFLGETLEFQGGQLSQSAKNQELLIAALGH